jgi:hypothetical protein
MTVYAAMVSSTFTKLNDTQIDTRCLVITRS